ncbi:MAG: cation:proton antiporter, partial [Bacteroidota bacterium]
MEARFEELDTLVQVLIYLVAFGIVAVASGQLAGVFRKIRLPLITGFLVIGLISGPEVLGLIDEQALPRLRFLNDIALAFIAFAVGSELHLKELSSRYRSIVTMTISQMVIIFLLFSLTFYLMAGMIPVLEEMRLAARIAVSLLAGTIAVACSPESAIAVINELRARGPFTQTSIGVTVVKDFLVIILFAVIFTLSRSLIRDTDFRLYYILQVIAELVAAFGLGFLVGYLLRLILSIKGAGTLKKVLVLTAGFMIYLFTGFVAHRSAESLGMELHIEPLLIAIIGSFLVTNFSVYRNDFVKIIKETGPYVYIVFFTLTGALISLEVLAALWYVTLILFGGRLISLFIAGYAGSSLAGDPVRYRWISWMPYITQAGVGVGLATVIAAEYGEWGGRFSTVIIGMIFLNLIMGPSLFKWALNLVREVHVRPDG